MAAIDAAAAASGIISCDLMERAGQAVAACLLRNYPEVRRAVVLCGPGNNGGDGYVAARVLSAYGIPVSLHVSGDPEHLGGDARKAHMLCPLPGWPLSEYEARGGDVVIDALFGAGLSRPVPPEVGLIIGKVTDTGVPVVAVDLPSGLCGRRGTVQGAAFRAEHTVTFMELKPGHVLLPGRDLCGTVSVFDIGIPQRIVAAHDEGLAINGPEIWQHFLNPPGLSSHKYTRGHLTVFAGPSHATGAARLSAMAGLKAGAGLVTVAAPGDALDVLAVTLTAAMIAEISSPVALAAWLEDKRHGAFVIGPGFGDLEKLRQFIPQLMEGGRSVVLDADAITAFRDAPSRLFDVLARNADRCIMTPHAGEFARLFPDLADDDALSKIGKALSAAARSHAVIILKGADTVIASPCGRALVNTGAPSWLATAGSGDVLAGISGGLLAQGLPAFEAAAAAVWLHGQAALDAGPGMTAEDLVRSVRSC